MNRNKNVSMNKTRPFHEPKERSEWQEVRPQPSVGLATGPPLSGRVEGEAAKAIFENHVRKPMN